MARGLMLQEVADAMQMTLRNYQKYESGNIKPTPEVLVKLADIFNVPTDFLLERDKYLKSLNIFVDISLENPPRHPTSKKN